MIASALRYRYLVGAGAALVAIAVIAAVLVVVTTDDGAAPAPEFTLNSTTRPIPDGVLGGGGSCTTITRSTSGESDVVHLLSSCRAKLLPSWIQLPGTTPARSLWIGESEAAPAHQASPQGRPARPQSMSPGSFRSFLTVVIRHLPELSARLSYRELREAFERLPLSLRRDLQRPAFTLPTESVVLYFQ